MNVRSMRVPVRDGIGLAATLYLPAAPATGAPGTATPVLLEYLPYRKDDAMLVRDYELYSYMTRHGYAGARGRPAAPAPAMAARPGIRAGRGVKVRTGHT
jgi:predicted acyl esterase